METEAAVLHAVGSRLSIETVHLDEPASGEVLIEVQACGVCHSDYHLVAGMPGTPLPIILGHEGAGVVVATGHGVSRVSVGEHVVTSMQACGRCRYCTTSRMHLCDRGGLGSTGPATPPFRFHLADGTGVAQFAAGAFARHTVVHEDALVVIDDDIAPEYAFLLGCGVSTGWGAAVHRGGVAPGDVTVIWGAGGVGIAAVAGATHAGASKVIAVDNQETKLAHAQRYGATQKVLVGPGPLDAAVLAVRTATGPRGSDVTIVTVGVLTPEIFQAAYQTLARGGTLVLVSVGTGQPIELSIGDLNVGEKAIKGSLMGSSSPHGTIPVLIDLYRAGKLDLEGFLTRRYPLTAINDAFDDLLAGRNVRGVITFPHPDTAPAEKDISPT